MKSFILLSAMAVCLAQLALADATRYEDFGGKIPTKGPFDLRLDYTASGPRTLEVKVYNGSTTFFSNTISIAAYANWLTIGITVNNIASGGIATAGAATLQVRIFNGSTVTYTTSQPVTIVSGKQGFHVWQGKLYDAREVEFIPRGVNNTHMDGDDGTSTSERYIAYHELDNIRKDAHANAVRVQWKTDNYFTKNWVSGATASLGQRISGPANSNASNGENIYSAKISNYPGILKLEKIIQKCIEQKMVPILELHDVTGNATATGGDPNYLKLMAQFWADNVWLLIKYRQYLIVNIANEWSTNAMLSDMNSGLQKWRNAYIESIRIIRSAGFSGTILVDCPAYAQNLNVLTYNDWSRTGDCSGCTITNTQTYAQNVINNDQYNNVMFSLHMYAEWATSVAVATCGQDIKFSIVTELQNIKNKAIPFLVGEFGHKHIGTDKDNVSRNLPINYWGIMRECVKHGFGFLAWSWCGNGSGVEYLDLAAGFSWTPYANGSNFIDGHSGNAYVQSETYVAATLSNNSNWTSNGSCSWGGGTWGSTLVGYYDNTYNNATYNYGNFGLGKPGVSKLCSVYDVNQPSARDADVLFDETEILTMHAFPNPMQTSTTFEFTLSEPSDVKLAIVDAMGRTIFLKSYGTKLSGKNKIDWNTSETNESLSGIYLYRLHAGNKKYDGKLLISQ
jgi:mannan endo-1,4-beta-mannosidase